MENTSYTSEEVKENNDKREICVIFGAETVYYVGTPTHERRNYVEGFGQLCKKCANSYIARSQR